jgi:HEAT repeat protein
MDDHIAGEERQNTAEAARLEQTGEFILHLIQAFLRTGYYLSDHPEARKAKAGLYEKFAAITGGAGEITFLIKEEAGQKNIFIEGLGEHPLRLFDLMTRGMAETYNPRFIHFLDRKELLSLSLLARMDAEEFSGFVDVMSEPSLTDMEDLNAKEQFVAELRERRVCNLSFVFREDLIPRRHGLPWRTMMALSRLKKDIHMLPIFRKLSEMDFHRVKLQTLADILRPLAVPELIYSFLLHIDLAVSPNLSEEDGENGVFSVVSEPVLIAVGRHFLDDASGKGTGFPEHVTGEKKARLLAKTCQRLNHSHEPQAIELVERMFNLGLIALEELHPQLRERVLALKWMTNYLHDPARYHHALDETGAAEQYEPRGRTLAKIIPYLIERNRTDAAITIVLLFSEQSREGSPRAASALRLLDAIAAGPSLAAGAKEFLVAPKETRTDIGHFFILMGKAAIPHLLAIFSETGDIWRRKQAVEILIALGNDAALTLMGELEQDKLPADSIPPVLRLLGGTTDEELIPAVISIMEKQVDNPHPPVRAEALAALCRLHPMDHFDLFRRNLADADLKVRKYAIRGIGLAGDARALRLLTVIIEKPGKSGSAEDWPQAMIAIDALGLLIDICPAVRMEANRFLALLVDQAAPHGAWKKLISASSAFPEPALLALTETIGRKGGEETGEMLVRLAGHQNRHVAERAEELFRQRERS